MLVVGVLAGSYLAARGARERTTPAVPALWTRRFGSSPWKRYAAAFAGGARHDVRRAHGEGMHERARASRAPLQLALSSWVFTPLMFASAAVVRAFLYGKEAGDGAALETTGKRLLGLATGLAFGALLQRGRVSRYEVILGQLLFRDGRVMKTMATAVAVGAVGIHALARKGMTTKEVKPMKVGGVARRAPLRRRPRPRGATAPARPSLRSARAAATRSRGARHACRRGRVRCALSEARAGARGR